MKKRIAAWLVTLLVGVIGAAVVAAPAHADSVYGPFLIENNATGRCADGWEDVVKAQWCNDEYNEPLTSQMWYFADAGNPFQYWIYMLGDYCLTPYGQNNNDGVIVAACGWSGDYQKWTLTGIGGGHILITSDWNGRNLVHPNVNPLTGAILTMSTDSSGYPAWNLLTP